jgi:hypothetical protein
MASNLRRLAVGSIAFGAGACLTTWLLMRDGNLKVSFGLQKVIWDIANGFNVVSVKSTRNYF